MAFERKGIVQLSSVVDIKTGFPFKSKDYAKIDDGLRLLRGDNIVQGKLRWDDAKYWPSELAVGLDEVALEADDVVLAMDRPWIEAGLKYARMTESDLPAFLVQRVARLRAKPLLNQRFLFYVIGSREFTQYILAVQTGTAVPHISAKQIGDFEFPFPPIEEQQKTVDLLGAIDDKIELNRKMNATLEQLAQALFKSWFVDFDPVKAKAAGRALEGMDAATAALFPSKFEENKVELIPKGWRVCTISDLVKAVGGATPDTKQADYWERGIHHWATPKDLSRLSSPVLLESERRITDAGLKRIGSGLLPVGTVLMSSRAPIGYLAISEIPVAINQGFIGMIPKQGISNLFVLFWAKFNQQAILDRANGSTFLEISKASFRPIPMICPDEKVMTAFDNIVRLLYQRIVINETEILRLAEIRDLFLPKLISGQIQDLEG
ncbi:MAG: restriction endonuclease subunit S [Blastocatellia bacterium]